VYHNIPITYNPTFSGVMPDSIQIVLLSSNTAPPLANEAATIGDTLFADILRFSSCTPDPNVTLGSSPTISPLPPGVKLGASDFVLANSDSKNISYTFTAAIPNKAKTTFMQFGIVVDPLDSVHSNNPADLPPGISVECGHPSCTLFKNSIGCYTLTGTLPSTNNVKYTMVFPATPYGNCAFFQTAFENSDASSQGARPNDTVTITVGTPTTPITQTVTPSSTIAPLEVVNKQTFDGGVKHSLFVCTDSTVKAVGDNSSGQLGDGTNIMRSTPVAVSGLTGVIAVSAGQTHSLFLKSDGTVWSCGKNGFGQLGNGTTTPSNVPTKIASLSGIVAISAGYNHSMFLKSDGTVWGCGRNNSLIGGGQLGDGTITQRLTPVKANINNVVQISGGAFFSLFLKNDGTAWATGANYIGQLGDGTTTNRSSPVKITSITNVRAVAAGFDHSIFLKNDGTVYTCGINVCGELADGTTIEKIVPTYIPALSGITAVDAGSDHNIYLKNDGTVYGSGINTEGEIGDGSGIERHGIFKTTITGVSAISAGDYFTLYNKSDNTVWGSGVNTQYQLGNGSYVNKLSPVQVSNLCNVKSAVAGPATGIEEFLKSKINTSIFPNPNNGSFTILADGAENAQVIITNILGEQVYEAKLNGNKIIVDLKGQAQGYYLYFIKNNNGILGAGKIIVE
jgi:alpha-tubulin suppressor-like RCC1 family protein